MLLKLVHVLAIPSNHLSTGGRAGGHQPDDLAAAFSTINDLHYFLQIAMGWSVVVSS
jgi:hypothetical protein